MTETPERVVRIADRDTTIAKLTVALGALKTGRANGQETVGILAPMRKAAAEGLADQGFRWIEAAATQKVVAPKDSWLGSHAIGHIQDVDRTVLEAALDEFNPDLAEKYRAAQTDEDRVALREEMRPDVEATLSTSMDLGDAAAVLRQQGRYDAAVAREQRDAKERGE